MLTKLVGFSFAFLLFSNVYAQRSSIKGTVVGNDNNPLSEASVLVLRAKDSIMVTYTRATIEGKFNFKNLSDTARFILFFTYPQYASLTYRVDMKDAVNGVVEVGKITMPLKAILLQEVLVKSQVSAIKIKGDTTEYNADSFKVRANASVEELLKQLPGLQVDQNGVITAQGQKVKKILVDGEEFFSDDPTLVARNLRADMIDKVQVYDKKSNAAAFTGIDDGVRDKTINLKIKEDKNHGLFGKINVGAGPDYYNGEGMINYFKEKKRMSVFGSASNTGSSGLGYGDRMKIGSGGDFGGDYTGGGSKGIPNITTGGAHYDEKWNNNQSSINGDYNFSLDRVLGNESSISQNNLPTGVILSHSDGYFNNSNTAHRFNARYLQKLDTTFTFTAYAQGSMTNGKNQNSNTTINRRGDNSLLYDNQASSYNDNVANTYNMKLSWEKKYKKKGRTLSFYIDDTFTQNTSRGENFSTSKFFDAADKPERTAVLNLRKNANANQNELAFRTFFTEPLNKQFSLLFNYKLTAQGGKDDRQSYTLQEQKESPINKDFSTLMSADTRGIDGGLYLSYNAKKLRWKAGHTMGVTNMTINSPYDALTLKKQFTNWNPSANLQYQFSKYKSLFLIYNGNTINPQRSEFIPFKDNNSQLSTYVNNPNLTNSFSNNFEAHYQSVRITSNAFFFVRANYTRLSNAIAMASSVSPSGIYAYQYINMNGYTNSNYSSSLTYASKIKFLDIGTNINVQFNGQKTFTPINNSINELTNNTPSLSLVFGKFKDQKYNFYVDGGLGYTFNKSSLQPEIRNNYLNYQLGSSARLYFFKKFEIHTDAGYLWQEKTQAFSKNFDRLIWNAGIGLKFLPNDQLTISISCHDLLNQNNGFSRTASATFFSENRYSTIQRFFLISALWSFNKFYTSKQ